MCLCMCYIIFQVCDRICLQREKRCQLTYCGSQDGLHFLTCETAAGDEMGWDFITMVSNAQVSITSYCDIVTSRYYFSKVPFMSRNTFTDWIFSWMANFKIDFRNPCKSCKYNPKILACDGTKLGMFFKNVSLSPFESPTCDEEVTPVHKRSSRQFYSYSEGSNKAEKDNKRQAQLDLQYFVAKNKSNLNEWRNTSVGKREALRNEKDRIESLKSNTPSEFWTVISEFIELKLPSEVIQSLCPVFEVLASECPLTSLVNYRFVETLSSVLDGTVAMDKIRKDLPEICNVLQKAEKYNQTQVSEFMKALVRRIVYVHSTDKQTADGDVIVEEYNPETQGRAYYFTSHGGRLRDLPKYNISKQKERTPSECRKLYPEVAKSGTTYLFLWFDPLHGHCYGFHVITTSEGRKDPFASAYMYMETPPDEVFYDFSCQLEEYSLNREPMFWRCCRFFHDLFHGFSHKCPYVYNSRRIQALDIGINTEICEQFNSYIQRIKFSARAMNQSHFMFYLQFFIHRWNEEKKCKAEKLENVAQSLLT